MKKLLCSLTLVLLLKPIFSFSQGWDYLSPKFREKYVCYDSMIRKILPVDIPDSIAIEHYLNVAKARARCFDVIGNEYDFIALHSKPGSLWSNSFWDQYDTWSVLDEKRIDTILSMDRAFEACMKERGFYSSRFDFFNSEIYPIKEGEHPKVVKLKKKLGNYNPVEVYWLYYFSFDRGRIDATKFQKRKAVEKIRLTGFKPFFEIANNLVMEINS